MMASELINNLQNIVNNYGDVPVYVSESSFETKYLTGLHVEKVEYSYYVKDMFGNRIEPGICIEG
jgi:hypothetical protein